MVYQSWKMKKGLHCFVIRGNVINYLFWWQNIGNWKLQDTRDAERKIEIDLLISSLDLIIPIFGKFIYFDLNCLQLIFNVLYVCLFYISFEFGSLFWLIFNLVHFNMKDLVASIISDASFMLHCFII